MKDRTSPSGPFAPSGTVTLVGGTATVNQPVPLDGQLVLTRVYTGGPVTTHWGALGALATPGATSFTITSADVADTSTVQWFFS